MQAQDAAASPDASAAQLGKRLRDLIARLDSVLPYLNLAISTVALLNQSGWEALQPHSCTLFIFCIALEAAAGTRLLLPVHPACGLPAAVCAWEPSGGAAGRHPACGAGGAASPLSPSRLMSASWHLRSTPQPGAAVFCLPEVRWAGLAHGAHRGCVEAS